MLLNDLGDRTNSGKDGTILNEFQKACCMPCLFIFFYLPSLILPPHFHFWPMDVTVSP